MATYSEEEQLNYKLLVQCVKGIIPHYRKGVNQPVTYRRSGKYISLCCYSMSMTTLGIKEGHVFLLGAYMQNAKKFLLADPDVFKKVRKEVKELAKKIEEYASQKQS